MLRARSVNRSLQVAVPGEIGFAFARLGQQEGIDPRVDDAVRALGLSGGVVLEQGGNQVQRQAEEQGTEEQTRHAQTVERRVMRQAVELEQVQAAQDAQRNPDAQHQVISEEAGPGT